MYIIPSVRPFYESVEEKWTQFKSILIDTIRNTFPKRPSTRKSLLHGLIQALNVLFAKSSDVTMPDTAIMNKIGANLKIVEKWYIMKSEKLTKTTSTNS